MKKILFSFILCFVGFLGFSFSNVEAKTINTDLGVVDFDLEQIQQDNPTLNIGSDYVIAKRGNLNDIILSFNIDNGSFSYSLNYNSNYNNTGYASFARSNIYVFIYNFLTNNFEYLSTWENNNSFIHLNTIYDTNINYIKYISNNVWYNSKLVSSNNFYNYDFNNLIDVADFSNDSFNVFTNDFNTVLNDYSNLSNYNNSLNNNVRNYILNETYKQYGDYYIGYLSSTHGGAGVFITDYPEQIYVKKCTGLYNAGVGVVYDENKPVYFLYNDSSDNMHIQQLTSSHDFVTSSNGNFFYDNINIARGFGSNLPITSYSWFSNINEIKVYDNFAIWFEDKAYYPGDTIFLTDNNKTLYLGGYYEAIPRVTFNSTYNKDSNDLNVSITINSIFSSFDPTNYKYYYKTNNDSDWIVLAYNQQMIDTKTFTKTFYENGNFAIKITDMQDNTLATYTYQWDQIDDTIGHVQSFGNNSFGINSRNITISSGLTSTNKIFDNITCISDRPFENDACYVKRSDFLPYVDDYLNSKIGFQAWFSSDYNSIPLDGNKYYLLNYRVFSDFLLNPDVLILRSGQTTYNTQIISTDVKENGIYKDYIITFQVTAQPSETFAITGFHVIFANLKNVTSSINDDFQLGIYKSFKIQQYDTQPTLNDVNSFYDNNSLDSISSGNSTDFFNNFKINDHGLSSLVRKPLDILSYVTTSTCSPIEIPFPNSNQVITLPCLQSILSDKLGILFTIIQTIFAGLICYRVCIGLFSTIKNLINPKDDKVEVIDL